MIFFVQGEDVKTTLVVENLAKDRLSSVGKTLETESEREGTERDGRGGGGGVGGEGGRLGGDTVEGAGREKGERTRTES